MTEKILIICGTGKVGAELVKLLNENGAKVRVATRNPSRASKKFPDSIENVEFDFEKPENFTPALEGIDKVFLMARPGDNKSDEVAIPFIDKAKKKGIRHIVNLTAFGVEHDDNFMLRNLEKYIEASGIPYTHLRPNWFMQNFNSGPMFLDIQTTGALHLPASNAKISFIDVRDIAAVGVAVLKEAKHIGKAYTLTGSEAIDHFQVVEILTSVAKKKITYVPISDDIARIALVKAKVAMDQIERWSNFYQKVREGFCSLVTDDIVSILSRSPITFNKYAMDYAVSWR
jgi:uncharacterized protein YbjT (DUF2867 family)